MGITMILSLLSGVALFLFGMSLMGEGLQKVAGNKLESILYRLTSSPIKGILLGTIVTSVIQSSSAATVMVIGFVNSGMMKVAQAIGTIMGANIGTSITGWILCLSYIEGSDGIAKLLSTATISAVVAIVGIILKMFTKRSVTRSVGDIMMGFAILMFGMQMMSGAVSPLKESETFTNMFTMFSNPIMGILLGIAVTAVIQSASAAVGILQALSLTGSITFAEAFPIIMGIGIGAACPVLLSSIGTNKNGKRTALVYLLNDLFGMIVWTTVFYTVHAVIDFSFMDMTMGPVTIALLNTIFRVATTIVLAPFIKQIEKLVFVLVKSSPEDERDTDDFDLLDESLLIFPDIAINQSRILMNHMVDKVQKNLNRSYKLMDDYTIDRYKKIQEKETVIDKYEEKIVAYLVQLNGRELSEEQTKQVSKLLHTMHDFERLGDYAVNISNVAGEVHAGEDAFSEKAKHELGVLRKAVKEIVKRTAETFQADDLQKVSKIMALQKTISNICDEVKIRHVERMQAGTCEIKRRFVFHDLLNDFERIADHCANVAMAMIELEADTDNSREYLKGVRRMENAEYQVYLREYAEKYNID